MESLKSLLDKAAFCDALVESDQMAHITPTLLQCMIEGRELKDGKSLTPIGNVVRAWSLSCSSPTAKVTQREIRILLVA